MAGPYNVPVITTANFSFGPGILKLGPSGTTPTLDVGSVNPGPTLEITGTNIDVRQGTPMMLIKRYRQVSDVQFSLTGIEWDYDNLAKALGAGITTSTQFDFGGDPNFSELALQFEHRMPSGSTQSVRIWKATGSGEMSISFGEDLHEFPMVFDALRETTDWAGGTLAGCKQYVQILKV